MNNCKYCTIVDFPERCDKEDCSIHESTYARRLRSIIVEQKNEIERLRTIVDKLPKTTDGIPMVPGMNIWLKTKKTPKKHQVRSVGAHYCDLKEKPSGCFITSSYSTYEAAEAAREK